jgi:hypothetical protein
VTSPSPSLDDVAGGIHVLRTKIPPPAAIKKQQRHIVSSGQREPTGAATIPRRALQGLVKGGRAEWAVMGGKDDQCACRLTSIFHMATIVCEDALAGPADTFE